jgi:hypothetical protein
MSTLEKISLGLFIGAEAFVLAAVGTASLPLVATWALAGAVVVALWWRVHAPLARVIMTALAMVGCLVMTVELGLFFFPAAVALFAAAVTGLHHTGHAVHAGR